MNVRRYTPPSSTPGIVAVAAVVLLAAFGVQQFWTRNPTPGDKIVALLWILLAVVILAAIGVVLGGGVAGVVKMWNKATTVQPDERGALPVHARTIRTTDVALRSLNAMQRTELARASRVIPEGVHTVTSAIPNGPMSLVYDADEVEPDTQEVPPLSVLLRDGTIRQGQFCIGFGIDGRPIYGTYEEFCAIGDGGTMGTGKSNDGAFYLAQVLAVGGQGYVADPNAGHPQSLTNYLGRMVEMLSAPVAKDPEAILRLVQKVRRVLGERIATNYDGAVPLILLIDEFTALMLDDDLAVEIPKLLTIINAQGRKYGVFVFLLAQLWGAEMTGGTKVRNLLAARICHNLPMQEARNLLGLPASAMPKDIGSLKRGECYVRTLTGALHRVTIPLVDAEGVADLRRRVASGGTVGLSQGLSEGFPEAFPTVSLKVVKPLAVNDSESGRESVPESLERWADALDFTPVHLRALIVAAYRRPDAVASKIPTMIDPAAKAGNRRELAQKAIAEVMREQLREE
jgi:hypothetical protein